MSVNSEIRVYDSARRANPALEELREVINYRNLIMQLVRRDVLTRYKRSMLGVAWTMLNPLGMMLVLTIAFSSVFKLGGGVTAYPAYVLSGLLPWLFFSQTTTAAMVNLVWGGGLLHRIYFPRVSFALAAIGTGLVNLTLSFFPLLLVMAFNHVPFRISLVFVPVTMLILACFSLGVGLLISTWAVYFPDVAEMYQILLTGWMYLTPIIYPETALPEHIRFWLKLLNPMYHLVRLFRIPIYYGRLPNLQEFLPGLVVALLVLVIGWVVFSRKADEFAYRI